MINKLFQKDEKLATNAEGGEEKSLTKKDLARDIFSRMYGKPGIKRKDIINAFTEDCGLTKAGASTYYADIKKKHDESNV